MNDGTVCLDPNQATKHPDRQRMQNIFKNEGLFAYHS